MCQDDTSLSIRGESSAYTSSRQAMEQVMDAVVDTDVDVAISQLSQPSQLSGCRNHGDWSELKNGHIRFQSICVSTL